MKKINDWSLILPFNTIPNYYENSIFIRHKYSLLKRLLMWPIISKWCIVTRTNKSVAAYNDYEEFNINISNDNMVAILFYVKYNKITKNIVSRKIVIYGKPSVLNSGLIKFENAVSAIKWLSDRFHINDKYEVDLFNDKFKR